MSIPITLTSLSSLPERGSAGAAGYDLRACLPAGTFQCTGSIEPTDTIAPGHRALIPTGVSLAITPGMYGRIAPRSGLAWKYGIDVLAGVIDSDYRGDVGVVLVNHGAMPFKIEHGDRIAQLIFEQCAAPAFAVQDVGSSVRGVAGYGSTGKN